jgi:hypothetical protein
MIMDKMIHVVLTIAKKLHLLDKAREIIMPRLSKP